MLVSSNKRKFLLAGLAGFLFGGVFAFSILVYCLSVYKSPQCVNLVLLGVGGAGHEGADLTDTIIFASVGKRGTVLVSLPRDLWYEPWQTKLNSLYFYSKKQGDGLGKTEDIIEEIVGQKIDFTVLVDFEVFKDLVDFVDGVDVVVERTFDDFRYPVAGRENDLCDGDPEYRCRYEHIRFEAGLAHLDGEQALKFVRSRYAEGEEGTDSARSARQQKVLTALREKIISPGVLLSPSKIKGLREIFEKRMKSDVSKEGLFVLGRLMLGAKARQMQSFVLDGWQEESGLIYHPVRHVSGQWVLLPKDPSWSEIHDFTSCLMSRSDKSSCLPQKKQETPGF